MDKLIAVLVLGFGLFHADMDAPGLWQGFVLPVLTMASLAYLFWWRGSLALGIAAVSYHFMDIQSSDPFDGVILPLLLVAAVLYFIGWLGLRGRQGIAPDVMDGSD